MPITKKASRRHDIKKGKHTRGKHSKARRSAQHKRKHTASKHKRKHTASKHKRKRTPHHKRRRHTRSMRGRRGAMHGGATSALSPAPTNLIPSPMVPSDLTNVYRTTTGGIMDTVNAMSGLESDPSPLPYKDQLVSDNNMVGEILRMA